MRLGMSGLSELRERLERLNSEEVMARALVEQAQRMAEAAKQGLSAPPGSGAHDRPWEQTGALQESIGAVADGRQAVIGSSDPAAAPQEMGTAKLPPRPFLAAVAAGMGEDVAREIGAAVAKALSGGETSPDISGSNSPNDPPAVAAPPPLTTKQPAPAHPGIRRQFSAYSGTRAVSKE